MDLCALTHSQYSVIMYLDFNPILIFNYIYIYFLGAMFIEVFKLFIISIQSCRGDPSGYSKSGLQCS